MATARALVADTLRYLYTGATEPQNRLNGAVGSGATSLTFRYPMGGIQAGARISVDLEDFYVWSTEGQSATVEPASYGSTTASHSDNAIVRVQPRFTYAEIVRAFNDELRSLSAPTNGLYRMLDTDLTSSATAVSYDLGALTEFIDVYEMRWDDLGSAKDWPLVRAWDVAERMPAADFPSTLALFIYDDLPPARTIRVRYRAGFGQLADLNSDATTDAGLPNSASDILPLGAAIRLTAGREIRRNFDESQGDTRRAEEVPPGANVAAAAALRALYQLRVREELARLDRRYPRRQKRRAR